MRPLSSFGSFFVTWSFLSALGGPAFADGASAGGPPQPLEGEDGAREAKVSLFLRADDPHATLERRAKVETYAGLPLKDATIAGVATWTPECTAPCRVQLDPKYTYRIAGAGLVPSDSFTLPRDGNPLVVDARMGSAYGRLGGLALSGAGAAGVILGGTAVAVSPILAHDDIGTPTVRSGVLISGIALTALSAFVLGAGIWLWTHNDTRVTPDPMRGIAF